MPNPKSYSSEDGHSNSSPQNPIHCLLWEFIKCYYKCVASSMCGLPAWVSLPNLSIPTFPAVFPKDPKVAGGSGASLGWSDGIPGDLVVTMSCSITGNHGKFLGKLTDKVTSHLHVSMFIGWMTIPHIHIPILHPSIFQINWSSHHFGQLIFFHIFSHMFTMA